MRQAWIGTALLIPLLAAGASEAATVSAVLGAERFTSITPASSVLAPERSAT